MFLARLTGKRPAGSGRWIVCIWWSLLSLSFPSPMGAYTTNLEFPLGFNLRETLQCNKEKKIPFCLRDIAHAAPVFDCYQAEVFYCVFCCFDLGCQPNCFFFFSCCRYQCHLRRHPQQDRGPAVRVQLRLWREGLCDQSRWGGVRPR